MREMRRHEHDSVPPSTHMCEIEPYAFLPPLTIVWIDGWSIGIEYLYKYFIRKTIDLQVWGPFGVRGA